MTADKGTTDRPDTEAGRAFLRNYIHPFDRDVLAERIRAIEAEARADDRLREAARRFLTLHDEHQSGELPGWPCNGQCSPVRDLRAALSDTQQESES